MGWPTCSGSTCCHVSANFKDRVFFRPDPEVTYTHIDALFGEPINWKLIESHREDLMRVAISIRQGKLSSVTLLRRLRHDSKRNKLGVLAALDQRITVRYAMQPMTPGETSGYLRHHTRLAGRSDALFSDDAAAVIHHTAQFWSPAGGGDPVGCIRKKLVSWKR